MNTVSIITVSFNSAATIRDTIESVLSQDYPKLEYIVIDGGSSDGTMEIVREYSAQIFSMVSEPDTGIYDAMNKGIRLATGDIVGMLNSDDCYVDSTSVRRLVERMESADADCVFADLFIVGGGDTERVIRHYNSGRFHPGRLSYGWMPAHPTFMLKRALYDQHGGYALDYRIAADFEMMVRLLYGAGIKYTYLPSVVIKMRAGGISTSGLRNLWVLNNEIVRACRAHGLRTSLPKVMLKFPLKLLELVRRPPKKPS